MYLIRICPDCGKKLRFPIDRGIIKVKCPCGYSFTADPDDTSIYKNAEFDLKGKTKKPAEKKQNTAGLKTKLILAILQYKYNLQNFKLLTWQSRKKVIFTTIIILFVVLAVIFLIAALQSGNHVELQQTPINDHFI